MRSSEASHRCRTTVPVLLLTIPSTLPARLFASPTALLRVTVWFLRDHHRYPVPYDDLLESSDSRAEVFRSISPVQNHRACASPYHSLHSSCETLRFAYGYAQSDRLVPVR
ncbi:MAG: hypothetical protein R3F28_15090 [Candidatus Kapaibacterium sp.]|nr:hypothetical protein [Ignavibacteria bacterium]